MRGTITSFLIAFCAVLGTPAAAQDGQVPLDYLEDFAGVLPDGSFAFALQVSDNIPPELQTDVFTPGWAIVELHQTQPEVIITEGPQHIRELLGGMEVGAVATLTLVNLRSGHTFERRLQILSNEERAAGRQLAMAGDRAVFGSTLYGRRLELLARGHFEALDSLREGDVNQAMRELGPVGDLMEAFMPSVVDTTARTSRYEGLIVMYAVARVAMHGACGDRLSSFTVSRTTWTEFRNGFGHYRGSTAPVTETVGSFAIPARLASIAERQNYTETPREIGAALGPIVRQLPCDSIVRHRLEENMLRYISGQSPAYVME